MGAWLAGWDVLLTLCFCFCCCRCRCCGYIQSISRPRWEDVCCFLGWGSLAEGNAVDIEREKRNHYFGSRGWHLVLGCGWFVERAGQIVASPRCTSSHGEHR
ncbi:hypothetical protein QBC39DRAFT_132657 [Podospora conica]|nr:hypothetical protein QBC39DRAFT_132657 [Schizothecium conicum]